MSCLLRKQWSSLEQGPQGPLFPQGQQPGASRDPREEASASFQARKQPLRRGSERQEPGQHLRTCPPTAPFFPEPDRPPPAGPPRPSLSSRGTAAGPLLSMESPTQVPYIDTACPRVCTFLSNTFKKQVFSSFPFQQHSGRVPRGGLHSWCGRCWETHAGPPSQWWRKTYVYRRGIKGGLTHARKAVPNKAEE